MSVIEKLKVKADLNPELAPYVYENPTFGTCIKHPLYFQMSFGEAFHHFANEVYEEKKKLLIEYREKKDWDSFLFLYERPYRVHMLNAEKNNFTDKEYWELLRSVYTDAEQFDEDNRELWNELLTSNRPQRCDFMTEEDKEFFDRLPEDLTVYRGWQDEDCELGFSWSLSKEVATWFATRFSRDEPIVTSMMIKKSSPDVVGYYSGRNEYEVVIINECDSGYRFSREMIDPPEVPRSFNDTFGYRK